MKEYKAIEDKVLIEEQCQEALWEIADLILYNKHPELYDALGKIKWDIEEINSITALEGKVVADVGAGSGRIAFLVASFAKNVFAVEPIASFRVFMKEKAAKEAIHNLYVMDGTLDSIPLPDHSLDVLITSNALGWNLPEELTEIERVVKSGGHAIHLLWSDEQVENPFHDTLTSSPWNYSSSQSEHEKEMKLIYSKII
jgi:ubiquinone/menaquinone biosynthesis C-methylase UbiE